MKIIKRPEVKVHIGTCNKCGAVVEFSENETVPGMSSIVCNYSVDCPMNRCDGVIYSEKVVSSVQQLTKQEAEQGEKLEKLLLG